MTHLESFLAGNGLNYLTKMALKYTNGDEELTEHIVSLVLEECLEDTTYNPRKGTYTTWIMRKLHSRILNHYETNGKRRRDLTQYLQWLRDSYAREPVNVSEGEGRTIEYVPFTRDLHDQDLPEEVPSREYLLDGLTPMEQDILTLRMVEGLTPEEICAYLRDYYNVRWTLKSFSNRLSELCAIVRERVTRLGPGVYRCAPQTPDSTSSEKRLAA